MSVLLDLERVFTFGLRKIGRWTCLCVGKRESWRVSMARRVHDKVESSFSQLLLCFIACQIELNGMSCTRLPSLLIDLLLQYACGFVICKTFVCLLNDIHAYLYMLHVPLILTAMK